MRSLTRAAQRLAANERHEPLTQPDDAELAELALAFNTMADQLAHQESLRRQMMADIAHELRTPLSVLRLQVEGLEDGVEQPTPEVFRSLREEVNLLERLINDLRLLSLADAGQLSLMRELIDPQGVVERVATGACQRARQQGIDLRVETDRPLPLLYADQQRLAQVLGNLLENALRYTPPGGRVTLRAFGQERSNGARLSPTCVFEVSDTGPGIAPEHLPCIFERFFRADRARTRETGGSGLGLAIVHRLVDAHDGQVEVNSTPGQGTTFRVILPIGSPQPEVMPSGVT